MRTLIAAALGLLMVAPAHAARCKPKARLGSPSGIVEVERIPKEDLDERARWDGREASALPRDMVIARWTKATIDAASPQWFTVVFTRGAEVVAFKRGDRSSIPNNISGNWWGSIGALVPEGTEPYRATVYDQVTRKGWVFEVDSRGCVSKVGVTKDPPPPLED